MDSYQRYEQEPQEGGGNQFLDAAGRFALGLGATAGAVALARRARLGRTNQASRQKRPGQLPGTGIEEVTVRVEDPNPPTSPGGLYERYKNAEDSVRRARSERPQGVRQGKINVTADDFPLQQAGVEDLASRGARNAVNPATTNLGSSPEAPLVSQPGAARSQEFKDRVIKSVAAKPASELPNVGSGRGRDGRPAAISAEERGYDRFNTSGMERIVRVPDGVQQARREQATKDLLAAAERRKGTYQPELPGTDATMMALRSNEQPFATQAEQRALGLIDTAESRPLSAAPDQQRIDFTADNRSDAADRILAKYRGDYEREVAREANLSNANENRRQQAQLADQVIKEVRDSDEGYLSTYLKDKKFIDSQGSSTQRQEARRPLIVEQTAEALDSGVDQMAGRIERGVQRNIDVNLNEYQQIDGAAIDSGSNPVAAAKKAAIAVEGEVPITQTDELANAGAESFEAINLERLAALKDDPQAYLEEFNRQMPMDEGGTKVVDNVRQRVGLRTRDDDATTQTLEGVLQGEGPVVDTNMRGRVLRGGKIDEAGDIRYQSAGQETSDADLGTRITKSVGATDDVTSDQYVQAQRFKDKAVMRQQMYKATDEDLDRMVANVQAKDPSKRTGKELDQMRYANDELNARFDRESETSREQLNARERRLASLRASEVEDRKRIDQRPAATTGPAADVARSMETYRTAMEVDPSEPIPSPPSADPRLVRRGFVEQELGAVTSAPSMYTGAARDAAGPVIFTGKSKANTVLPDTPVTGRVDTTTGRYSTIDNPDRIGSTFNVAGTPRNQAIARQVEDQAQGFLVVYLLSAMQVLKRRQATTQEIRQLLIRRLKAIHYQQ